MYIPTELFVNPENERAVFEIVDRVYTDISCKVAGYDPNEAVTCVVRELICIGEVLVANAIINKTIVFES